MKITRFAGAMATAGALIAAAGCTEAVEDIDRTQPNALQKELFRGEWYFARTVVDVPYETDGTFVGDRQEYFFSEDFPALKVRWRIEENRLMACRSEDLVIGANSSARGDDKHDPQRAESARLNDLEGDDWKKFPCDHPVAAFRIESHFDILRDYNAQTGEQSNVIRENTSDRPWHERSYFRIDWTDIGLTDIGYNLFSQADMGWLHLESPYYVQEEAGDCRAIGDDGKTDYSNCEEGFVPPIIDDGSILLTNRITLVPYGGLLACAYGWQATCTLSEVGVRYSFMKVPERTPEEAYEPLAYPDTAFERFGIWRVKKPVYVNGRGETDFKQYLGTRWHIWEKTQTCDAEGANCTPLPLEQRKLKPIAYYLNRAFPQDLKPMAFEIAKGWNDAYDGISPTQDVVNNCKVVCGSGKSLDQCSAADPDWRMEGDCAFTLAENNGTQFLGDLRYNFIAYIEDPGQSQPCGVGGPANDPETGELINATSYVYGAGCFDWLATTLLDQVDLLCAQMSSQGDALPAACECNGDGPCGLDENQYLRGQKTLEVLQAQGYVQGPRRSVRYQTPTAAEFASNEFAASLEPRLQQFSEMGQFRGRMQSRADKVLKGEIGKSLIPNQLALEISNGRTANGADLTTEELEFFNPMDPRAVMQGNPVERMRERLSSRAVETADFLFTESGLWAFAKANMNLSRADFMQLLREQTFKSTTLHELGHNMGLRHNFVASFDRANYPAEYWDIVNRSAAEFEQQTGRQANQLEPFQANGESEADFFARYQAWETDRETLREIQAQNRIREYRSSSIMDYGGLWYSDWKGLGGYDKAAMRFVYASLVDRLKSPCQGNTPEACQSKLQDREPVKWFMGGELCGVASDCPHADLGQRCCPFGTEGYNCTASAIANDRTNPRFCTNWDDEERSRGYNPKYQFCSDDRVSDQPFCNRWDEGESSEEIVRNMIESYERGFIFNNFRRYRSNFTGWGYFRRVFTRYFTTIGDQMQSMMYKYYYEPGFRQSTGPGGFYDMFRATILGFDFLGNVLARPEAGLFRWNEQLGYYEYTNSEQLVENPTADLVNVPMGVGKPIFSAYETGYFGETERLAYVGTFYDKLAAIWTLTLRDWGASQLANENRFLLSFYDFFPNAFLRMLGSAISGDRGRIGMPYDAATGTLHELTHWDGTFFGGDGGWDPDSFSPNFRRLESGMGLQMSQYALIYGMIYTPVFFDLSFINAVRVFELGSGGGFDTTGIDPENVATCTSPTSHRTFVAVSSTDKPSVAWHTIELCQQSTARFAILDQAVSTGVTPDGMTMNEVRSELADLGRNLSEQEDRLSNMVYLVDVVGLGSL